MSLRRLRVRNVLNSLIAAGVLCAASVASDAAVPQRTTTPASVPAIPAETSVVVALSTKNDAWWIWTDSTYASARDIAVGKCAVTGISCVEDVRCIGFGPARAFPDANHLFWAYAKDDFRDKAPRRGILGGNRNIVCGAASEDEAKANALKAPVCDPSYNKDMRWGPCHIVMSGSIR
jgi:hypothetical protein